MHTYKAVTLLALLFHGLLAYAKASIASGLDISLGLRRLEHPLLRRGTGDYSDSGNATDTQEYSPVVVAEKFIGHQDSTAAPSFNSAAFNTSAMAACQKAVANYPQAVNPSGLVACYNIAFFDNTTGVFLSDVRLYQKSSATGSFQGLSLSDMSLGFAITQATVSNPMIMAPNQSTAADTNANGHFVTGFQNIGQLSKSLTYSKLTPEDLRVLMIPSISLGAIPPSGGIVNTSLSSDMLSYVAGELVQANGSPTNITTPQAVSLSGPIVSKASVFVLPGTQIKTPPVGLVITCIWTGLLGLAVGAGTIGRYQFRAHYRQRLQLSTVANNSTIPWDKK